nr:hypothetical protein [Candidatus Cloacimonadota bacterium]
MNDVSYHVVNETDNARILELYRAAGWWEQKDDPANLQKVGKIIANSFCFVIAVKDDEIIGMGRALSDGESDAYIQDVTVWEAQRGNGYGKGIVNFLVNYLHEHNIYWIALISEPGYEGFYNSLGFSEMKGYTPFLMK